MLSIGECCVGSWKDEGLNYCCVCGRELLDVNEILCCKGMRSLVMQGMVDLAIDGSWYLEDHKRDEMPIEYCPFCGKELPKVEVVE